MITADQLLAHAIGDYIFQSDWMATEKTKRFIPAFAHALVYSVPFLLFQPSLPAWAVIFGSHFLIDRYRLARYLVWAKNLTFAPPGRALEITPRGWPLVTATGYPEDRPAWLAVWLLIIADNIMHVVINGLALRFL